MSEDLAHQTLTGIYEFCEAIISEVDFKSEIVNHLKSVLTYWPQSWFIIKQWLLEIEFKNKEQAILSLVKKIPQLKYFENILDDFLKQDSSFWDDVFTNLRDCQTLLKKE